MTLHLHRAERADTLAAALAELLAQPLQDVFAEEVVAVPARGIERWLTQRLSHHLGRRSGRADGICAAVRFPSPAALIAEIGGATESGGTAQSRGTAPFSGTAEFDPWSPDAAAWPLLQVIDAAATEPWCRALADHLGYLPDVPDAAHRRGRRYAVARRVAGLFDGYARHRPDMLAAWAAGRDEDGWGRPVPADMTWQPELWRRLGDRIDGPDPVARLTAIIGELRTQPMRVPLPERVSLFGPTALPARQFRVLTALAEHREVHLWLPHPSPALWSLLADRPTAPGLVLRSNDPDARSPQHPLLSSLGRDAREMQAILSTEPHHDVHHPADGDANTLMRALQRDLRDDRRPGLGATTLAPQDNSIQVHACHGPARQVEVLRDVIIGLLADDPTLQPSDILVMCPDIEAYAPLVQGAFGLQQVADGGHPAHRLWVRLADRALTQTNPLLSTVGRLLDLADGRITASDVLDLAAWVPVRRRFSFDDDDLERLSRWVDQAGARWGLDAQHRSGFGLQEFPQNTWRAGLDRILLGVAMAEEDNNRLATALPLDDVGSSDVALAGRFAELLARLTTAVDAMAGEQSVREWQRTLQDAVGSLTRVSSTDGWQAAELHRELAAMAEQAALSGSADVRLGRTDIRALLAGKLAGRPTRANFRTGTLTVCTMVPMRSVPHRVVCLLGLDDGVFPRAAREDGDNLLARDPAVGERDPRSEDRQLLLDALMAATDTVVITYTGADERTGQRRPPAVPLGELLDALDDTATRPDGKTVRDQILIRHPLQPFDPRTVKPGELGRPGPFTFDPAAARGARAAAEPRHPAPPFLHTPLPPLPVADIELEALIALLTHPAKGFLRQRLEVAVPFEEEDPPDALTVELDQLQRWGVGDRLLRDRLAGVSEEECRQAEWRRGILPPGPLGVRALQDVFEDLRPLVDGTAAMRAAPHRTVDVTVDLAGGRQLRGTVSGVRENNLVTVSFSKLAPAARLKAWINLLALTAAQPETPWTATTVGRGRVRSPEKAALPPLSAQTAGDVLGQLVDLYDRGLQEPLPLPVKSAAEYAISRSGGGDIAQARQQADMRWATSKYPGEDADAAHVQVWGRRAPLTTLMAPRRPDEQWGQELDRFGELAVRLWFPLLRHEQRGVL